MTFSSSAEDLSAPVRARLGAWLPALVLLLASFVGVAWLALRPIDDRFVAAVFPPWWDAARSTDAVAAADGAITGWGGLGSIVLARSDSGDFPARLHAADALLLLEPSHLIFCGGTDRTPSSASGDEKR
jgi:hypothetical protein